MSLCVYFIYVYYLYICIYIPQKLNAISLLGLAHCQIPKNLIGRNLVDTGDRRSEILGFGVWEV